MKQKWLLFYFTKLKTDLFSSPRICTTGTMSVLHCISCVHFVIRRIILRFIYFFVFETYLFMVFFAVISCKKLPFSSSLLFGFSLLYDTRECVFILLRFPGRVAYWPWHVRRSTRTRVQLPKTVTVKPYFNGCVIKKRKKKHSTTSGKESSIPPDGLVPCIDGYRRF